MKNLNYFRNLEYRDIKSVLRIYNFHIKNGFGNFEERPLNFNDFSTICKNILDEKLPFVICLQNDKIVGFTYLSKFRNKSGYKFSFEDSIYVHQKFLKQGIGNKLLNELVQQSKKIKKIKTIIAVISSKNKEASINIHKKNGFVTIGTLKKIGFKKDKWLDSTYMQKIFR